MTSKPADIPQDVWDAAQEAFDKSGPDDSWSIIIARAILAERERMCEGISAAIRKGRRRMRKPDDIPQDVWDAAVRALDSDDSPWEILAGVITAERERCAKVSEAFGAAIAIAGPSGEFLSIVPYVAGAIRSGLPAESVSQEGVWLAPGGGFVIADKGWDRQAKLTPGKA